MNCAIEPSEKVCRLRNHFIKLSTIYEINIMSKADDIKASKELSRNLLEFIDSSPTPFHATENMAKILKAENFVELDERNTWDLEPRGKYYIIRGESSIIAFRLGEEPLAENGFRIVGAHTDSPCLKVKPNPDKKFKNYISLGVEIYGGVLLSTWFDRDLSIAGRVSFEKSDGSMDSCLINFENPIVAIPNLAIHLNRESNENRTINKQKEMPPILMQLEEGQEKSFDEVLIEELEREGVKGVQKIYDYDLFLYPTQKGSFVGYNQEFINSMKLDNLLSCYIGMSSLLAGESNSTDVLICSDHEEVGSSSDVGAGGPFLKAVLQRIAGTTENFYRSVANSMLISADNAHGVHPNYSDKHDENHGPIFNQGPVVKSNANQRYATQSMTSSIFQYLCDKAESPVQHFVTRSDMGCGSTIGPITASEIGIKTIDIGVPTFAMHSTREMGGTLDVWYLFKVLKMFYSFWE